jgi:hypothetical protein
MKRNNGIAELIETIFTFAIGGPIVLLLLSGLCVWLWGFVVHPETVLPYLGNLLVGFFYMFSWWIAFLSGYALFGPHESIGGFRKIICALALVASVLCIIDSFGKPSHGHMEYSEHSQQWIEDDPE